MKNTLSKFAAFESGASHFLSHQRTLLLRLVLLSAFVLLTGQIAISWFAVDGFEETLEPQLKQKANVVGYAVSAQIHYAVDDLMIPTEQLVGMDSFFDNILQSNQDIEYLALQDSSGNILYLRGIASDMMQNILGGLAKTEGGEEKFGVEIEGHLNGSFPVVVDNQITNHLHVGVSSEHIRTQLTEILYEVIAVIAISWLVTLEFLRFFMGTRVSQPIENIRRALADGSTGIFANHLVSRTKDEVGQLVSNFNRMLLNLQSRYSEFHFEVRELKNAQIDDKISKKIAEVQVDVDKQYRFTEGIELRTRHAGQIRVPLFLFIFSEEMSRSFLPLFVSQHAPHDLAIPFEFLVGLPITLFMLAAMIATPLGGTLVDRLGTRRIFLVGILAATLGFIGNFLTQSYIDLILWRVLTGIGYGLVFIASEGWVTQNAAKNTRASSTGVFVHAVFVGIICGPPLGGIIANRIGYEGTFLISAGLAIISGIMVYQVFDRESPKGPERSKRLMLGVKEWFQLLTAIRFVSVVLLSSVPGKMMVAGFMAYLVPLFLYDLGHSESSIGRIMMLYGLSTIVLIRLIAQFADRSGGYGAVVALGTAVAGLGCIVSLFADAVGGPTNALIIAILTLGIGHALTLTSQNSMIQQVAERYRSSIGVASVIGAYRLVERIGMVIGPIVAAILISIFGYQHAIVAFGCILLGLISLFVLFIVIPDWKTQTQGSSAETDSINA